MFVRCLDCLGQQPGAEVRCSETEEPDSKPRTFSSRTRRFCLTHKRRMGFSAESLRGAVQDLVSKRSLTPHPSAPRKDTLTASP